MKRQRVLAQDFFCFSLRKMPHNHRKGIEEKIKQSIRLIFLLNRKLFLLIHFESFLNYFIKINIKHFLFVYSLVLHHRLLYNLLLLRLFSVLNVCCIN